MQKTAIKNIDVRYSKKYILIITVLLVAVGICFFQFNTSSDIDKESIVNYPPTNTGPIVAFGDSLVSGVGAWTAGGFVTMLSEDTGKPILNFGRGGDTATLALSRIDQVIAEKPSIVIILLGGNDYLNKVPKEETFANLEHIITKLQGEGSVTLLLGVRGGLLRDSYESDYQRLAEETGSAYVPNVLDGLLGEDAYMDDVIHPNEVGYRIIAEKVHLVLREILP